MKKIALALLVVALLLIPSSPVLPVYAQTISITLIDAGDEGINFGEVAPGTNNVGDVSQNATTPAVRVWVESESASVNISIKGTSVTGSLPLSAWEYSKTFNGTKVPITSNYEVVYSDVTSNSTYDFYHWVNVPAGTAPGSHTANISYKADVSG